MLIFQLQFLSSAIFYRFIKNTKRRKFSLRFDRNPTNLFKEIVSLKNSSSRHGRICMSPEIESVFFSYKYFLVTSAEFEECCLSQVNFNQLKMQL